MSAQDSDAASVRRLHPRLLTVLVSLAAAGVGVWLLWRWILLAGLAATGWRLFRAQVLGHRPRVGKSALEILVAAVVGYLAGERRKLNYFERKAATKKWSRIAREQHFADAVADPGSCPFLDD